MKIMGRMMFFVSVAAVAAILAGQLGLLQGTPPGDLGVRDGRLKPPSLTGNSVSSQAGLYQDHPQRGSAMIAPFSVTGDGEAALTKIESILRATPRTTIIKREPGYLYAQCSTALMHFTDDLEFWFDNAQGVIQVRSASRLGAEDLGANRSRVETIRAQFLKN